MMKGKEQYAITEWQRLIDQQSTTLVHSMAEMKEVCDELSMNSVLYDIVMLERSLGKLKELLPNLVQAAGNTIEMKHKMIIGGKVYHALFADHSGAIGKYVGNDKSGPVYRFPGGSSYSYGADELFNNVPDNKWVEEFYF